MILRKATATDSLPLSLPRQPLHLLGASETKLLVEPVGVQLNSVAHNVLRNLSGSWCPRPDLNRNQLFRKQLLYPVELRGRIADGHDSPESGRFPF